MKLTRSQLICAKDVQLHAVGIVRSNTRGWLQKALDREFTDREVSQFHFATRTTKKEGKFILSEKPKEDDNVEAVRRKLEIRARIGLKKYGVTTERPDLSKLDWLRHAQEEAMDLAVYLEVLIRREEANACAPSKSTAEDFANELFNDNGGNLSGLG